MNLGTEVEKIETVEPIIVCSMIARTQPYLPLQRCLFHAPRDLYWSLYREELKLKGQGISPVLVT